MKTLDFIVDQLPEDPRLDKVIPLHLKDISRSLARKLIETGGVYLNKKRCQKNGKLVAKGDKVRVVISGDSPTEKDDELSLKPEQIVFEDDDIIVVNKPPGLPTHETIDTTRFHLVLAVQNFLAKREKKKPAQIYLGVHHRLDRDTSGIILFTKRKEANAPVAQAFQDRTVEKTYLAISLGRLEKPAVIKSFLGPSARNKRIMASVQRGGKFAETEIRPVEKKNYQGRNIVMVEAKPKTGRMHQIRVHLSENRLPILGDRTYGVEAPGVKRVLLHAWKLDILGKSFLAPLPDDFRSLDFHEPRE